MQCGVAQMGEADAQKSCAARNKAQTPDTDGRLARVGEAAQKGSWAASRAFLVNGPPVKLTVSAAAHCDWGKGGVVYVEGKGKDRGMDRWGFGGSRQGEPMPTLPRSAQHKGFAASQPAGNGRTVVAVKPAQ